MTVRNTSDWPLHLKLLSHANSLKRMKCQRELGPCLPSLNWNNKFVLKTILCLCPCSNSNLIGTIQIFKLTYNNFPFTEFFYDFVFTCDYKKLVNYTINEKLQSFKTITKDSLQLKNYFIFTSTYNENHSTMKNTHS